jgi:YD repeat-containing protein
VLSRCPIRSPRGGRAIGLYWREASVIVLDNYNGSDPATQNTTTGYTYDSLDRLTQVTDPSNLSTTYQYDGLSDATGQTSPDTGATSRTFDAAGDVLTRTDTKGITATNTYDALDRLVTTSYVDTTQNVTYSYDDPNSTTGCGTSYPTGRLTRIIEATVHHQRALQGRADSPPSTMENQRSGGTGHARMGVMVQPPTLTRTHRVYSTRRGPS